MMDRSIAALMVQLLVLLPAAVVAGTGDRHFVKVDRAKVYAEPSTQSTVVVEIGKGHELIEFSRQGGWLHVGPARTGGKDGWILYPLVSTEQPAGGATVAPPDPKYDAFARDVQKLNANAQRRVGFPFFTKVENLGDGIVWLTAHPRWLSAPEEAREGNLATLFKLWDAHEGSGLPIAVCIVDARGRIRMEKSRGP